MLLLLLLALWILLQTPFFQNWLVHIVTKRLSKNLNTRVDVDRVSFSFFNKLNMEGVMVEDQRHDTLLTAGLLQVNITDWFFFKDSADLKYVKLADVTARLHRDSTPVWNYQFLIDYFSGNNGQKKKSSGNGIALNLKVVDLENIRFLQLDEWKGKSMIAGVGKLHLEANKIDFNEQLFDIETLVMDKPEYREFKRSGRWGAADSARYYHRIDSMDAANRGKPNEPWNPDGMVLRIKQLRLNDGVVEIFKRHTETSKEGLFDATDILINSLTGNMNNLSLLGDTLRADVDLRAKERSGLELKRMKTDLRIHPQLMEFANLDLVTNKSRLTNYYAMRYNSLDDMEDFIDKVRLDAKFDKAIIDIQDVAFFSPALKDKKQAVVLSGVFGGTIADFDIRNLEAITGKSVLTGDYHMTGLTDMDKTIIEFNTAGSTVNIDDINVWSPGLSELKNSPLGNITSIKYAGNFKGTIYDFKAKGNIATNLGNIKADWSMKLKGPNAGYTGIIETNDLQAGKLLDVQGLGLIDFAGTITGKGLTAQSPILIDGVVRQGTYNGYTYHGIGTKGIYQNNKLNTSLDLHDENLAGKVDITLDFNKKREQYIAQGYLSKADFRALKFTKDTLQFSGLFDVNFKGKTIDDFLGYARLYDARLLQGSTPLSFDSLVIESTADTGGGKHLSIHTNEADIDIRGKYNISNLPKGFQLFLNKYYPAFIDAPKGVVKNQDFRFDIDTRNIEPFMKLIDKNIQGLSYSKINGNINTASNQLNINASVPFFKYGGVTVNDLSLKGKGNFNLLNVISNIGSFNMNDSLSFPNVDVEVNTNADTSDVKIKTSTGGPLGDALVDARIITSEGGIDLRLNESSFILNNKKWTVRDGGNLQIRNKHLISNGLVLEQESQKIALYTLPDEEGESNNAYVSLSNINIGDFLPYILKEPRMEGLATGKLIIGDPLGKPNIQVDSLTLQEFRFNNDSMGIVRASGNFNTANNAGSFKLVSPNKDYDFTADINLDLNDSTGNQINTFVAPKRVRLNLLEKYLDVVFDEVDGYATTGNIQIKGNLRSPLILGETMLTGGKLKVGYTKCTYFLDSSVIRFGTDFIDFGKINIRDVANRPGTIQGKLYHHFFQDMSFDFKVRSEKLLVLNTKAKDNGLFYGNAVTKAEFDLTGPTSDMRIRIAATPADSSHIFIPNTISRESGDASYIIFEQYGREMESLVEASGSELHVDVDLTANNFCKIDVILDDLTGDVIRATGNGNLKISTGSKDETVMRGRYNIEKGEYTYRFQSLIRKPFVLQTGDANYIEWNGDPGQAMLNVKAVYTARNVRLSTLSGSGGNSVLDNAAKGIRDNVLVIANIRGQLSKPDITFDLEFPQGSAASSNVTVASQLQLIRNNETELLKQVTYLIVFGSFAPYGEGRGLINPGADLAVNTISEIISAQMGRILTNLIHQITGDNSLTVDFSTSVYSSADLSLGTVSAQTYDRTKVDFNIGKSFFNDRIIFNIGSDFDFSLNATSSTGFQFLPDVSAEFILTSNRKLRGILFKRDNLDVGGRRNRAGGSISFREDFDTLGELFGRKKRVLPATPVLKRVTTAPKDSLQNK